MKFWKTKLRETNLRPSNSWPSNSWQLAHARLAEIAQQARSAGVPDARCGSGLRSPYGRPHRCIAQLLSLPRMAPIMAGACGLGRQLQPSRSQPDVARGEPLLWDGSSMARHDHEGMLLLGIHGWATCPFAGGTAGSGHSRISRHPGGVERERRLGARVDHAQAPVGRLAREVLALFRAPRLRA